MKFHCLRIGIFLVTLTCAALGLQETAKADAVASGFAIQSLVSELSSPEKIARYIWRNFSYEADQSHLGQSDVWQTPDQLIATQKGDCEDFALFALNLLKENGISAFLINVYGNQFAHTVCVFKENGKYQIIDGNEVKRINADNLNDVFSYIYPYWKYAALTAYDAESDHGKILKVFQK